MIKQIRQSTLETLGLGSVLDIFNKGKLPVTTGELVDKVFGNSDSKGSMVISGANGIVGAGKAMQFGVRLMSYNVPLIALDIAGSPDGIGQQYQGLVASFGKKRADEVISNIIRINYDGKSLPDSLKLFKPRFLLEAIPEILELKKMHYNLFMSSFSDLEIRSVTSGFPSSELGVGIAHPAFPHQINKVWEIVEKQPSDITKLLWSLGLIPIPVSDNWSFVLDVLFCGLTLAGLRYHQRANMPFWKLDKFIRRLIGPNPYRAHDVIGAKGANFLTWSCLHHLSKYYGELFTPTSVLEEHKDTGSDWYPLNHLRPVVNWELSDAAYDDFEKMILGALFQMTSLMLHENRSHLSSMNLIGELCAQFRSGTLAVIRKYGADESIKIVEAYHRLHPESSARAWYPDTFSKVETPEWQHLYVNAEHNGNVGVITIARESYNWDVDTELNRAIEWLKSEKIENVIITGDYHLSSQLVGADINEFFSAFTNPEDGYRISFEWSKTARRLNNEFKTSVAFINGKRCLGGMLELLIHCHYVISVDDADLGAPEVTLPVVPGMEMCHLPFRKSLPENWRNILKLLLDGKPVKAKDTVGWLVDYAGTIEDSLKICWKLANGEMILPRRVPDSERIYDIPTEISGLAETDNPSLIAARKAILDTIQQSCAAPFSEALSIQSKHSAGFMTSKYCRSGVIGSEYSKTMEV